MNLEKYYELCLNINKVYPINKTSADYICKWINDSLVFSMLEIGSGIGYNSNYFIKNSNLVSVVSIEKKFGNYLKAKKINKSQKINFIWKNFLDFESKEKFPLIFWDLYNINEIEIFNKASNFLNYKGVIIINNIGSSKIKNDKNFDLNLVQKIESFKNFLLSINNFSIKIIDVDNGIAICEKNN